MKKFNLNRKLIFKNGEVWKAGQPIFVKVEKEYPHVALINQADDLDNIKKVKSEHLYMYINDFVMITMDALETATFDSVCPSLLGYDVEPDGWDEYGFPSILQATCII